MGSRFFTGQISNGTFREEKQKEHIKSLNKTLKKKQNNTKQINILPISPKREIAWL